MRIRELFTDDDAVSPVIGVILMVAITVILAAVIGTFVLGLGDQVQDTAPQASFGFDYDGEELQVSHSSGDTIQGAELYVRSSADLNVDDNGFKNWQEEEPLSDQSDASGISQAEVRAGWQLTFQNGDPSANLDSENVRVVWQATSGDNSDVMGDWSGPDA